MIDELVKEFYATKDETLRDSILLRAINYNQGIFQIGRCLISLRPPVLGNRSCLLMVGKERILSYSSRGIIRIARN